MQLRTLLVRVLQVLTRKYERAIEQKMEAEEASIQAQLDVTQLIKLCEFCKWGVLYCPEYRCGFVAV